MEHAKNIIVLPDGRTRRLGRIRPKSRPRALRFGSYRNVQAATVTPPMPLDYSAKAMAALEQMYLNDTEGDCVVAGKFHAVGVWTGNETGTPAIATNTEVQSAYVTICGPGDQGCNITDFLDYFQAKGLTLAGVIHKIDGYVSVDWRNKEEVQVALYLFGALTIGINLPAAWTTAKVWDVTNTAIVGGHDVTIVGYNATGVTVASWGELFTMTWAALESTVWVEEMYAMLAGDWYGSAKLAPCGVDAATLQADLAKIGGGTIPPINPTPTPAPVPVLPPSPTTLIPTTLALVSSANPAVAGTAIVFDATVQPNTATGRIVVNIDAAAATADFPLVSGVAQFALPYLDPGTHGVVAKYLGDGTHAVSSVADIKQVITAAPNPSPNPAPAPDPTPVDLTLDQAIAAMTSGIKAAEPFPIRNAGEHAIAAGTKGLTAAWPAAGRRR